MSPVSSGVLKLFRCSRQFYWGASHRFLFAVVKGVEANKRLTCPNALGFKSLTFSQKTAITLKTMAPARKNMNILYLPAPHRNQTRNQTRNLWFPKCRVSFSSRTSVLGAVAESATQLICLAMQVPSHEGFGAEDSLEFVATCEYIWGAYLGVEQFTITNRESFRLTLKSLIHLSKSDVTSFWLK